MNSSALVVFIYDAMMTVGGIETYIYKCIKDLRSNGVKTLWIKKKKTPVADCFKEELYNDNLLIVEKKPYAKKISEYAKASGVTSIKILAFSVFDFADAENIKRDLRGFKTDTFYFVPHFCGNAYYLEESFKGKRAEKVRGRMKPIFEKLYAGGNLKYFSKKHIASVKDAYGVGDERAEENLVPTVLWSLESPDERLERLYNREEFKIVTVSRIDFPHKAFMHGLLKTFIKMKPKHPRMSLTVIGDGPNINDLRELLMGVEDYIVDSVKIVGAVAPDELSEYYKDANLSVSVAGSLIVGAKLGVLSIPARHYNYDCEVYGFLPDAAAYVLSDEKGEGVEEYIEKAMSLTFDEYSELCRRTFEHYKGTATKTKTVLELENAGEGTTLSKSEIKYIGRIEREISSPFVRAFKAFKREGLIKPLTKRIKRIIGRIKK